MKQMPAASPSTLLQPLSPLSVQMRRRNESLVGRGTELEAVEQELESARAGRITCVTLEGEPGIGKTRLLVAAMEHARQAGFLPIAVGGDEELRGPFLLARGVFSSAAAQETARGTTAEEPLERALDAISGRDDPAVAGLSPDAKLLRTYDLAAIALCAIAGIRPLALLVDDLQWADEDSLRMLRYVIRSDASSPIFLMLAVRPEEMALVTEAVTLLADMERMGLVRRLRLARFTQTETAQLLQEVLAGRVNPSSAAAVHAQAEGVPFIVRELAHTYRDAGMVQQIDGVWTLARNAERLVPSAVRTLIQRRAGRLPQLTKDSLGEAAVLGRSFSLRDLRAIKQHLGDEECEAESLAEALVPAVTAGLLLEHREGSAADYTFTHEQVREFAVGSLSMPRRRAIHAAIVEILTSDGDAPEASLPLLAHHALAAGDAVRAARFSIEAARSALSARAPEEVLRLVELALPVVSAPQERVGLLRARDEALEMLRRPADRLEGLAELGALSEALGDPHLELEVMLRRAAALRRSGDHERAAQLAQRVVSLASERADRESELAACLELGQALLRSTLGEGYVPTASEVDLDAAEAAFGRAAAHAEELGDEANLAAVSRELGVIDVARVRAWFVERAFAGDLVAVMHRVAGGESLEDLIGETPIAPLVSRAGERFQRALELFERLGDQRGVMSSIIAMAYLNFGADIHIGPTAARRIEEIRRLSTQMQSLSKESDRAIAEIQMLYGVHVFSRAKAIPDLALARGKEAYQRAREFGDRSLELLSAGGVAVTLMELGDLAEARQWLDRAASAAAAAPTPLRARQLELWRGVAAAAVDDRPAMRQHLEHAARLATEQGLLAARCEALATLALESARLGAAFEDDELLSLAERSARQVRTLARTLPGHPPWSAQAEAALARIALARGRDEQALEAAGSALAQLQAALHEDVHLEILLPAARVVLEVGPDEERQKVREELRLTLGIIAQRTLDEDVRVRWFQGPLGRELVELAGPLDEDQAIASGPRDGVPLLGDDDAHLLKLVAEGRTNQQIAEELGLPEETVIRRLAEMFATIGASSRAQATAFAFQQGVL